MFGLAILTLLHEDVAIAAGASLVSVGTVSIGVTALALLGGIIAGDVFIYVLGMLSLRISWIRRRTEGPLLERCRTALQNNLLPTLVTCRIVPGVLFPTYFACGAMRVPFLRFTAITLVTAGLHVGLLLTLMTSSLESAAVQVQVIGIAAAAALMLSRTRRARSLLKALAARVAAVAGPHLPDSLREALRRNPTPRPIALPGLPVVPAGAPTIGWAERIPPLLFYIPLVVQWAALGLRYRSLSLPTAANPSIEAGGLLGESKIACMDLIGPQARQWAARSMALANRPSLTAERLAALAEGAGLSFPLVAKPDIGWRGIGVRLVRDAADLLSYLRDFPAEARVILQEHVPHAGEAGIFYVRKPGERHGRIFSMTFRYYPHVVGDGRSSLRDLIAADPRASWKADLHHAALAGRLDQVPAAGETVRLSLVGSSRVGGLYKDACPHVTATLTARFDEIADAMPGFHFGRFDVRFESVERLALGEGFRIIEVNGAGAEAIHMWDPDFRLADAYATLFHQQALMFEVADANRARGAKPLTAWELVRYQRRQQSLLPLYPASN
ncbi:VTT domain-containing protein [Azospirillum picis]|uniref:Membrane protein DedA with SNARE-associated domain n=1 Tax=Azospirillum picis TaxID=488438 RepID=A0ABU0MQG6_9PROT|nr:VTT domain-containing protein [Azospirillum picis]MBP2302136.1 membrane protein DedA with SNARE-associated domain [Azospirillum picis]MDQ0535715.1 membrane protein DedA with SNARE-associated domain [Azospirillum picis]